MSGVCGRETSPTPILRNGMDFVPKKTYPPDYSNVPDVRSWQMSPFAQERFDLDEIQRAEKKGFKGRFELQALKEKYYGAKTPKLPERKEECLRRPPQECYTYAPYGPPLVPTMSYSQPIRPRSYKAAGPPLLKDVYNTVVPCRVYTPPRENVMIEKKFRDVYIPYGPFGELRLTWEMYEPMGPTLLPQKF